MHKFLKFIFGIKLYMFRTVSMSIIRRFSLYTEIVYVIQVFRQLASRIRMEFHSDPARKLSANCMTYTIAVFTLKNS